MSNKTSDENVGSIEDDVKEIKESIEEAYRCYEYDLDYNPFSKGIAEIIERILADYTRQKEMNEEHQKINGELRERVKELEKYTIHLTDEEFRKVIENAQMDTSNDRVIAHRFAVMQQQINEKDKRIKELEEYIAIAPNLDEMTATKYIVIQEEAYIRGKAEEQQKAEQIIRENYIPKQVVIDKIKENKQILDKTNDGNLRERLYIENGIMKELLREDK